MRRFAVPLLLLCLGLGCGEARSQPASAPPQPAVTPPAPIATPPAPPGAPAPADAGSPAGACEGARLDLLAAIANTSCRISEGEADQLRNVLEDATKAPLGLDAERLPDGRVRVRITNTGNAPQALPLLTHSHLDNFAVRVKNQQLSPPDPDWPPGFSFATGRMLTKIVLPPGGTATATFRVNTQVVSHEIRNCPANAKCAPTTVPHGALPPGTHRLKLRTPLYSIRADLEATLDWKTP